MYRLRITQTTDETPGYVRNIVDWKGNGLLQEMFHASPLQPELLSEICGFNDQYYAKLQAVKESDCLS